VPDNEQEKEEIAKRIRSLRKARDFSIGRLAELAGMSAGYLSEVERGYSEISGVKLARLAEHLGVSADYLLSGRASEGPADMAVQIPPGLSEAAKTLDLTYAQTLRLLAGKQSLVAARRRDGEPDDWKKEEWIDFYKKVEPYL
jgi:transcriptional regulator with XRE-family HTH domain